MNRCSTVDDVLRIRDRLAAAVTDAAEREQRLNTGLAVSTAEIEARRERDLVATRETLEEALDERSARFESDAAALAQRRTRRAERIERAFESGRERLRVWLAGARGRRKNKIQISMMQAERVHDEGLAQEEEVFLSRREEVGRTVAEFTSLELETRRQFREYAGCIRLPRGETALAESDCPGGYDALMALTRERMEGVCAGLAEYGGLRFVRCAGYIPSWLIVPVAVVSLGVAIAGMLEVLPVPPAFLVWAWVAAGACLALCGVHFWGRRQVSPIAQAVARNLDAARTALNVCGRFVVENHRQRQTEIEDAYETTVADLEREWKSPSSVDASGLDGMGEEDLEGRVTFLRAQHVRLFEARRTALEGAFREDCDRLRREAEEQKRTWQVERTEALERVREENAAQWRVLVEDFQGAVPALYEAMAGANEAARGSFPEWDDERWSAWVPPETFADAVQFGQLKVDLASLCKRLPGDSRLVLPGPGDFSLPVCLTYPAEGSVLFETRAACRDSVLGTLNNMVLRLLSVAPPGKVAFTFVDPVELGQNFAGVMHLADYEEGLVNRRIWTQPRQIEERLGDLNEHIEKVIQMYLRNEYATIADYNRAAGDIAEKYHFLVVADFPTNFTELAVRRLLSIASSGPRCGVYLLLHWDTRRPNPQDFVPDELRDNTLRLTGSGQAFGFPGRGARGSQVVLNEPPETGRVIAFLKRVGQHSIDSNRVEVPFARIAPPPEQMWSLETQDELRVPIGRTGATKLQYLALGRGTRQHVLIAGKTGSGKSTLFHVLVSNLALWCSPDQVEFYLVDFKKGVEFKCYATQQLPHARVVAIESDREFGLSVLERVDEELKRRGDLFRKLGAQDLAGYRKAGGEEPLPRTLLIVDEFQEFFVEEDRISQAASLLLDRIVRQGRAFGIHVLLGSQTLGGAYTLTRATLGQMSIRVALQCNETDAYLIMDDDNSAPRLLSRPGEAIYNDDAGRLEGNSPFQVVWLSDEERDRQLGIVRELAEQRNLDRPPPVVFEGNAPSDVASNTTLCRMLGQSPAKAPSAAKVWLGEPNRIKGPTEATFVRQSGSNLLVVGQRDEAVLATLGVAMVSLAAQHRPADLRLVVLDGSLADSAARAFLEHIRDALPHDVTLVEPRGIPAAVDALWKEMGRRNDDHNAAVNDATTFCFVHGVQRFKRLRYEEDFGFSTAPEDTAPDPGNQFNDLIRDGSSVGIHLVVTCDTYGNINRVLNRKAIAEFDSRVLFQMGPNDSASLIDSPAAAQLGLHRALFHSEQQGYTELFRPYALPDEAWIAEVAERLAERQG